MSDLERKTQKWTGYPVNIHGRRVIERGGIIIWMNICLWSIDGDPIKHSGRRKVDDHSRNLYPIANGITPDFDKLDDLDGEDD